MIRVTQRSAGFSLVEVALAVALFAIAILTLVGLGGPLMRQVSEDRNGVELGNLLAALDHSLKAEARLDYARLVTAVKANRYQRIGFLVEGSGPQGPSGWQIGTLQDLARLRRTREARDFPVFPWLYAFDCRAIAGPGGRDSPNFQPILVEIRRLPMPDPTLSTAEMEERFARMAPTYSVHTVFFR